MVGDDELTVAASTFKIAVALEVFCQGAEGDLDLAERVRLLPAQATPGGQGFCVSVPRIHGRLAGLGLDRIRLAGTIRQEFDAIGRDAGFAGWAEMQRAMREAGSPREADRVWARALSAPSLRPGSVTSATAGQMAALLKMIWRDEAGPADACAAVRAVMGQQRLTRKIAAGFGGEVLVAAKSGTVPGCVSNDAGVVRFPDGSRFVVAVFTRPLELGQWTPRADSAIGTVARLGVEHLRRSGGTTRG